MRSTSCPIKSFKDTLSHWNLFNPIKYLKEWSLGDTEGDRELVEPHAQFPLQAKCWSETGEDREDEEGEVHAKTWFRRGMSLLVQYDLGNP